MTRRKLPLLALACIVLPAGSMAQTIELKAARFDPSVAAPTVPFAWRVSPAAPSTRYLVRFGSPATTARHAAFQKLGAQVEGFVPANTYIVRFTGPSSRLSSLPGSTWVGPFHPLYKLCPELGQREFLTARRLTEIAQGVRRAVVTVFEHGDPVRAINAAEKAGLKVENFSTSGTKALFEVVGSLDAIKGLAKIDDVQFVEDAMEATFRNERMTWTIQSNIDSQRPLWDRGLRGQNMIVGIIDGRLDLNHNQFRDPNNNTPGPNHRKVVMYASSTGADSHGTHVCGTVAGDREPVNGQTLNNGIAPKARIAFTDLGRITSTNLYSSLITAHNAGARSHGNSWGNDGTTAYTSWCEQIDRFSWDYEESMVAFAVTNTSALKTPENAKSCMAVGASQSAPNQASHGSGGTGPTADGRRKPEVYSPGVGIVSASSGTTDSFRSLTGTSMACPSVTGMGALIRQWFMEGRYIETLTSTSGITPSGALLRSMLINTCVDMTGVSGYPSNLEGFGRLLADNVLWAPGETRRTRFRDVRNANGLTTGETRSMSFLVASSDTPLRISMTFTDFPGTVNSSNPVVNDMDLEVRVPSGETYLGNVFNTSTGQSVLGGQPDTKNSTEMVIFSAPQVGSYTVTVRARAVNQGNRQGYALVVNGNLFPLSPGN